MKIAIASGKGGTGKTTVATTLAYLLSNLKSKNIIYVDMDVEEPNGYIFLKPEIVESKEYSELIPEINEDKCVYCGKCADVCVYNAISIIKPIKKAIFFEQLCHSCGACAYVCPVEGAIVEKPKRKGIINKGIFKLDHDENKKINFIEGVLDVGEPSAVPLISGINRIIDENNGKNFLYILDAPPGTSCPVVNTIESCDYVVLVTEPTPFGINDLKLTLDVIKDLKKDVGLVINKWDEKNLLAEKFAEENNLEIIGKIPFKKEIAKFYSKGELIQNLSDDIKNEFNMIAEKIIWRIYGES